MFEYRKGLPDRPERIARLPVDERGYPIPFFVAYVDGVPDFRIVDHPKVVDAALKQKCFICGDKLGQHFFFATGPRSAILMKTNHGPSHKECIEYSLSACPFILYPNVQRRRAALPDIPLSFDQSMQPARPPIYVVAHVFKHAHINHSLESLVCSWDTIDYRFWRDDQWITPGEAEGYIAEESERHQSDLLKTAKPSDWSQTRMDKWLQDSQMEATQKTARLLAWIAAQQTSG